MPKSAQLSHGLSTTAWAGSSKDDTSPIVADTSPAPHWGGNFAQLASLVTLNNLRAEAGEDVAADTAAAARVALPLADLKIRVPSHHEQALTALGTLGFVAASITRQHNLHHGPTTADYAFRAVPHLEDACLALANATGHPPRDSAATAWLHEPPFSFTGTDGERRFGAGVRSAERLLGGATDLLGAVRAGRTPLADAVADIRSAVAHVTDYTVVLSDMAQNPFPVDFIAMRNFLVPLEVGRVQYEPPNATYIPGWNRLDVAVGICPELTNHLLAERIAKMPTAHAAEVRREQVLPALSEVIAATLGIPGPQIHTIAADELACRMRASPPELHAALAASCDLAHRVAKMIGVHWGVIRNNLPSPIEGAGVSMTHAANAGVSGRSLAVTQELKAGRLTHPLVRAKFTSGS
jgi:hypothetical protein